MFRVPTAECITVWASCGILHDNREEVAVVVKRGLPVGSHRRLVLVISEIGHTMRNR